MGAELATAWTLRVNKNWYDRHPEHLEGPQKLERAEQRRPRIACNVHRKYHTVRESYAKHFNQRRQEEYVRAFSSLLTQEDRVMLRRARVVPDEASLEQRFIEQADKWENETKYISSVTKRVMHPSYQAILGMGRDPGIVPILLRDLQKNRRPWFTALSYITQHNPINPQDAGKMDKMISAWVNWGKDKGLL